jgi:hypothetical protein
MGEFMITIPDMRRLRQQGLKQTREALARNTRATLGAVAMLNLRALTHRLQERDALQRHLRRFEGQAFCVEVE